MAAVNQIYVIHEAMNMMNECKNVSKIHLRLALKMLI